MDATVFFLAMFVFYQFLFPSATFRPVILPRLSFSIFGSYLALSHDGLVSFLSLYMPAFDVTGVHDAPAFRSVVLLVPF